MDYKGLHDELLAEMPEGAQHDADSCSFCSGEAAASDNTPDGGGDMSDGKTYTQDELDAAVAEAVAQATSPLAEELADLKAAASEEQTRARIEEVRSEYETKVTAAEEARLAAETQAEAAKAEHTALVTWLEQAKADADAEAELARVAEERLEKIQEVASFNDEFVAANKDRWAAMDEDAFTAMVETLGASKDEPKGDSGDTGLGASAMTASSDRQREQGGSAVREVFDLAISHRPLANL